MSKDLKRPKKCKECGKIFLCQNYCWERKRFCSRHCLGLENARRLNKIRKKAKFNQSWFGKGKKPWNIGIPIRNSPKTEFKKGQTPFNKRKIGTTTIRVGKNGEKRAWVKIKNPNKWILRSVFTWQKHFGKIYKGKLIHHKDRNPLNDEIKNLSMLTRSEHLNEHRSEFKK